MLLLHGIYGSGRNWGSVARRVVAERPEWSVILVDMRCHGQSRGFPPPHTVAACAGDLLGLEERLGFRADAVLGHSYGGKVALVHARMGRRAPRQIWLIDSSLGAGRPGGAAWRMLDVLRRRPGPFPSRKAARAAVEAAGFSPAVAAWMATNAIPMDGKDRGGGGGRARNRWKWRLNPDDMEALMRDYFRTDAWDVVEDPSVDAEFQIVRATRSSALDVSAVERLRVAAEAGRRIRLHEVAGGHWLNADNPEVVQALLAGKLR